MGRNGFHKRLVTLEAHMQALLPEAVSPTAENIARQMEWKSQFKAWWTRLIESMAPDHRVLLKAYALEDRLWRICHHTPCLVPRGLAATIFQLWRWLEEHARPIALPPVVVEVYLSDPQAYPRHDCEDCGYPIPVSHFFDLDPEKLIRHFPRCPQCGGVTGWHAWDITHGSPGYGQLKPYGTRRHKEGGGVWNQ